MNLRRALELVVLAVFIVACRATTPITSRKTTQTPRPQTAQASIAIDTSLRAELLHLELDDQKGREDIAASVARNDTAVFSDSCPPVEWPPKNQN
jgi:hypothetical protein